MNFIEESFKEILNKNVWIKIIENKENDFKLNSFKDLKVK